MKKRLIEQQNREKAIIESFSKVFLKIKRIDEDFNPMSNDDYEDDVYPNVNYEEIVKRFLDMDWENEVRTSKVSTSRFSRRSGGGTCTEYEANIYIHFDTDDIEVEVSFGRWCEEDPDGPASGMHKTLTVNGKDMEGVISNELYDRFEQQIEDYDSENMQNDYDDY